MRHAVTPTVSPTSASRHALHAFLVGMAVDVWIAAALFTAQAVAGVSDATTLRLFALALLKTVVTTAATYSVKRLGTAEAPAPSSGDTAPQ